MFGGMWSLFFGNVVRLMQQVFLIADGVSRVGKIIVERLSDLGHRVYYGSDKNPS